MLILLKQKQNFAWVYIKIIVIAVVIEIYKFKVDNKDLASPTLFCLGKISNKFDSNDFKSVSSNDIKDVNF